jgi:DNA-binding protein HU-beta
MNKNELISQVHRQAKNEVDITKQQVKVIVNTVFDIISKTLEEDEKVQIQQFGTFEVTNRKGRIGINPHLYQKLIAEGLSKKEAKNKALIDIESTRNVLFKAAEKLKNSI